jgi:hypothetical protein
MYSLFISKILEHRFQSVGASSLCINKLQLSQFGLRFGEIKARSQRISNADLHFDLLSKRKRQGQAAIHQHVPIFVKRLWSYF